MCLLIVKTVRLGSARYGDGYISWWLAICILFCRLVLDFSFTSLYLHLFFASSPAVVGKPLDGIFSYFLLPFAIESQKTRAVPSALTPFEHQSRSSWVGVYWKASGQHFLGVPLD